MPLRCRLDGQRQELLGTEASGQLPALHDLCIANRLATSAHHAVARGAGGFVQSQKLRAFFDQCQAPGRTRLAESGKTL